MCRGVCRGGRRPWPRGAASDSEHSGRSTGKRTQSKLLASNFKSCPYPAQVQAPEGVLYKPYPERTSICFATIHWPIRKNSYV